MKRTSCAKRIWSALLSVCLVIQVFSGSAISAGAAEAENYAPDFGSIDWKYQNNGSSDIKQVPEGGVLPSESGKGIVIDYTKFNNESVVVYDPAAPRYTDSELEFDVTVQAEQSGFYRFIPIGRFQDGRNYAGLGYDTQYMYNCFKNGSVTNKNYSGAALEAGKSYHAMLTTKGSVLTLYINGEKAAEHDAGEAGLTGAGSYAFRVWGGDQAAATGKKVLLDNIQFRAEGSGQPEQQPSRLTAEKADVEEAKWGQEDILIPVSFVEGSALESVKNGDAVLNQGTDYTVSADGITVKKEFIASLADTTILTVTFQAGEPSPFTLRKVKAITTDEYIEDFSGADLSNWIKQAGTGNFTKEEGGMRVTGQTRLVDTNSPAFENGEIELWVQALNDDGQIGISFRNTDAAWQSIYNTDSAVQNFAFSRWNYRDSKGTNQEKSLDSPFFKGAHHIKVRYIGNTISLWINEQYTFTTSITQAEKIAGKMGFVTEAKANVLVKKIVYRQLASLAVSEDSSDKTVEIKKDGMTVLLDDSFPRVLQYNLNGKTMLASQQPYYYVTINSNDYKATAAVTASDAASVTYRVDVPEYKASMDVVFTVEDNHVLAMTIRNIKEEGEKIRSFAFPNQAMLSANSKQEGAKLDVSFGFSDAHLDLATESASKEGMRFCSIPVVTANGLSAAMANNAVRNLSEFAYQSFDLPDGSVSTGVWTSEFLYRGWDNSLVFEDQDLYTKVILTEDTNSDAVIDWQDGANALKYLNKDKIVGSDTVSNSMVHVGYNFASILQNPYLKVADNIKRLGNLMDGFGQILVFKGYASEGHDSGHADYENINERAGGAPDMNTAIAEMAKYNATMGIHINHSEAYPEAKMFNDEVMSTKTGWKWLDQSRYIRREVDIINGGMDGRLDEMFNRVPGIGFVYVDTYRDERWAASRIARNLSGDHQAIMATEEGYKLDRWTAWSHGAEHGTMHRFVYHTQKDIYNNDKVLRGGYDRGGSNSFMGWQRGNNISSTLKQFYTSQLPQKYLMHYNLTKWTPNTEAIFDGGVASKVEDGKNNIYKDGKLVATDSLIFIPWFADDSKTQNPDEAAKIYHWNPTGGETTWELPASWAGQTEVKLYENSQTGKNLVATIPVVDGKVTINAEANTPYVVYKGNEAIAPTVTEWSVGSPIKDTSFNSRDFSTWSKSTTAENDSHIRFEDDSNGVSSLIIDTAADGSLSQTMTGLVPGQKYRMSVWAGAINGKRASITVKTPDGKEITQYTDNTQNVSFAHDHYSRNQKYQLFWVDFIQPEGFTTAEIILSAGKSGSNGRAQFMETRIVKTDAPDLPDGYVAWEDFENVDQQLYGIFSSESIGNTTHLSETHEGYTTDTISGQWSFKFTTNIRTTPSTVRLKPYGTYQMNFNTLQSGSVQVLSESTGEKVLDERLTEGAHEFTFTTGKTEDFIVRFTARQILDDFIVKEVRDDTPPSVPQNVKAEELGDSGEVLISWDASVDEDTGISGYLVYRNGVQIDRVADTSYTDRDVQDNTSYVYEIAAANKGFGISEKSEAATLKTKVDNVSPTVTNFSMQGLDTLVLTFSEKLNKQSAENCKNYHLTGYIAVNSATLGEDGKTVILKISGLPIMQAVTLTVSGVYDRAQIANAMSSAVFAIDKRILRDYPLNSIQDGKLTDTIGGKEGTVSGDVKVVEGMNGDALQLSGTDSKVTLDETILQGNGDWSVSLWTRIDTDSTTDQTILSLGDQSNPKNVFRLYRVGFNKMLNLYMKDSNGKICSINTQTKLEVGVWNYITVTKSGTTLTIYANDKLSRFSNNPGLDTSNMTGEWKLGSYVRAGAFDTPLKGTLQGLKTYSAAITLEQIKGQMNGAADTTLLASLVQRCTSMEEQNYLPAGWKAFAAARTAAEEALADTSATQALIDSALNSLGAAMEALTPISTISGRVLDSEGNPAAKATVKLINADGKTVRMLETAEDGSYRLDLVSYGTYLLSIEKVGYYTDAQEITVGSANTAIADVTLIQKANRMELVKLYYSVKDKLQKDYTAASWTAFDSALKGAKAVLDTEKATQKEVDDAKTALQTAIDNLVNISTLSIVLDMAKSHVTNGDVDKLIPAAKAEFEKALAKAQGVYDNANATQSEVDASWKLLLYVIQALDFVPGDDAQLIELVAAAKEIDLSGYEDGATKDAFTTALSEAEALLLDKNAMQADFDAAYEKLEKAMSALIPLPVTGDKTQLGVVIETAEGYDLSKYVDDANKTNFSKVLAEAKDLYDNNDKATQGEIDAMRSKLLNAMNNLRLRADKETLNDWINALKGIDLNEYTAESASALRAVIAKAEALAAQDLGKDETALIQAMIAEMVSVKENLVKAEDPSKPEEPSDSSSDAGSTSSDNSSTGKPSTDKTPTTGDAAPIAAIAVLAIAAFGTMLILKKRRQ